MTEKRFTTVELPKPNKWGIWYDGAYLSTYQVCILLNDYVDVKKMNEELKIDVNSLITHYNGLNAEYEWLKEENEELKQELTEQVSRKDACLKTAHSFKVENEQLKYELKVYRKLARCSNCEHHNYDWFDDGDEFEVCEKGNDVTQGICEEWEEL